MNFAPFIALFLANFRESSERELRHDAVLSLRFNQEEFCDELYLHRKTPRLLSSRIQAAVLIAG